MSTEDDHIELEIKWRSQKYNFSVSSYSTLRDLKNTIQFALNIPADRQRFLGFTLPRGKSQPEDDDILAFLGINGSHKSITLIGSTSNEAAQEAEDKSRASTGTDQYMGSMHHHVQPIDLDDDAALAAAIAASTAEASGTSESPAAAQQQQQQQGPELSYSHYHFDDEDEEIIDYHAYQPIMPGQQQTIPTTTTTTTTGIGAGERFTDFFESNFGLDHPQFYEGDFADAFYAAKRDCKFLVCILLNKDDEISMQFCRETLTSDFVSNIFDQHFVVWCAEMSQIGRMSSLHTMMERNPGIAAQLNPQLFPYITFIAYQNNGISILDVIEGYIKTDDFIGRVLNVMEIHQPALEERRAQRDVPMSETAMLHDEQDRAYMESLRKDQEKERRRQEEEYNKKVEDAMRLSLEQSLAEEKERRRQRLPSEPTPEEVRTNKANITTLLLRMPNGERVTRRFRITDTVQTIFDFLHVQYDIDPSKHQLLANSPPPPRTFTPEKDGETTLKDARLYPQCALFVHARE